MRKKIIIAALVILVIFGFQYRYELLFRFQYARLKGLACQTGEADFINDSCLNKIWVHRVNSDERFELLKGKFAGYESDVVWDSLKHKFSVFHPPFRNKGFPPKLDGFLSKVNTDSCQLWLDMRETPPGDTIAILQELNRLDSAHAIKMNAIIEVYDPAVANYLAEHGFWISMHILNKTLEVSGPEALNALRLQMSPRISFVSQEDKYVPKLKQYFPGIDIITWSTAFSNYFNRGELKALVADSQVKVVLVNVKSKHYR
ncbi:MAG: hypothetical protein K0Q66_2132 [Chitinophagaceae bacterium]|jgi:hypothetical protein|nr:hypothetical protein [Chitinophagaceae bacterium]